MFWDFLSGLRGLFSESEPSGSQPSTHRAGGGPRVREEERRPRTTAQAPDATPSDAERVSRVKAEDLQPFYEVPLPRLKDGPLIEPKINAFLATNPPGEEAVKAVFHMLEAADQRKLVEFLASRNEIYNLPLEPILLRQYLHNKPSVAKDFLWSLNFEDPAVDQWILTERDSILERFAACGSLFQMLLTRILRLGTDDAAQTVMWVATRLLEVSEPTRCSWRPSETAGAKPNDVPIVLQNLISLPRFSLTHKGCLQRARLMTLFTGRKHLAVVYEQHDNDCLNFRRIEVLPTLHELQCQPDADKMELLKFSKRSDSLAAHLDRHFRLMREDALSPLREAFSTATLVLENPRPGAIPIPRKRQRAVPYVSRDATLELREPPEPRGKFDNYLVVRGTVKVERAHPTSRMNDRELRDWYANSRAFFADGTIAFLKVGKDNPIPVTVARPKKLDFKCSKKVEADGRVSLSFTVAVVGAFDLHADALFKPQCPVCQVAATRIQWTESAMILHALQDVKQLPFEPAILQGCQLEPIRPSRPTSTRAAMSPAQATAFHAALSSTVTLIQGPPGTGKTFLGTNLVTSIVNDEPDAVVLIMAYTNHALDQLLVRIYEALGRPTKKILRLGFGSKDETVLAKMWYPVVQKVQLEKQEYSQREKLRQKLEDLFHPDWWGHLEKKLLPFAQFQHMWEPWAAGEPMSAKVAKCGSPELNQLFEMNPRDRKLLRDQTWAAGVKQAATLLRRLEEEERRLECHRQRLRAAKIERSTRVIGLTTTFAAKNAAFVARFLGPTATVLIEESAEILEARVLACLSGATQLRRLVMIGDHLQLPPKVSTYQFQKASGQGFDLDCSLFERLVLSGVHYHTLDVQHRMLHRLSNIVRHLSYPTLKDATPANDSPIPGFAHQLFFVDHDFPEGGGEGEEDASKSNRQEAKFVVGAARHLALQGGVAPSDITILTPYLGQVRVLRAALMALNLNAEVDERDLEELSVSDADELETQAALKPKSSIRVSTIDNFQGEESRYVLVSMVRCNRAGDIGWVKERQRATVLLSRAKEGMLVFGSKATLTAPKGSVWQQVFSAGVWDEQFVGRLRLRCHNQKHRVVEVAKPEDFDVVAPNGGCDKPCGQRLECGHRCTELCHPTTVKHTTQCRQMVERQCPKLQHSYEVPCSKLKEGCPKCRELEVVKQKHDLNLKRIEVEHKKSIHKMDLELQELQSKLEEKNRSLKLSQERLKLTEALSARQAQLTSATEQRELLEKQHAGMQLEMAAGMAQLERLHATRQDALAEREQQLQAARSEALKELEARKEDLKKQWEEEHRRKSEQLQQGAIGFPAAFRAPIGSTFADQLRHTVASEFADSVPRFRQVVAECLRIADDRCARQPALALPTPLTTDEAVAIALYTYDLGSLSTADDGSDNFYFALNRALRSREPTKLKALLPFLWHFKKGLDKLPQEKGLFFRGVPSSAARELSSYEGGAQVFWNGATSVTSQLSVAERFSGVSGGVLFRIQVVNGRSLRHFSAVPPESETLLEPGSAFVVCGTPKRDHDGRLVIEMAQVDSKSKITF